MIRNNFPIPPRVHKFFKEALQTDRHGIFYFVKIGNGGE